MEIYIKTQAEFDKLPGTFKKFTYIYLEGKIDVVTARGNSQVTARDNSQVTAWGNSQVTAWGNSQVTARGNSQVTAWDNSQVTARGNSQVTARDNSQVTARGNSQVTAYGNVSLRIESDYVTSFLFGFACALLYCKAKITKKSKNCQVYEIKKPALKFTVDEYIENDGVNLISENKVILYKRVSKDFQTQEGTPNETIWKVGETLNHPNWKTPTEECGPGKYHACSHPYFCDEFRSEAKDIYIALEVNTKDMFTWKNPSYPHKVSFKSAKVLYVCDYRGNKID